MTQPSSASPLGSSAGPRRLQVSINGQLVPREEARVSVWDSGFQSGDAVYEGLRVYGGAVFRLDEHVDRLFRCARSIGIDIPLPKSEVADSIRGTVRANGLTDNAHVRITVTRGAKPVTGMNPDLATAGEPTIVVIAEPKPPSFPKSGISLVTASIRRSPAACLDPKLHTCNQLGQILAKMEANVARADEALMLDVNGFVAETNSANIFAIMGSELATPTRDACMPGLTRAMVLEMAPSVGLSVSERNISQADLYGADEVFISGTVCEIVPVILIDGRRIGSGKPGPVTTRLLDEYLVVAHGAGVPADDAAPQAPAPIPE